MKKKGTATSLAVVAMLLYGVATTTATSAYAEEGDVAINAVTFPDTNFRSYVSENIDVDQNGVLDQQERDDVKTIEIHNAADIKGIEYFNSLDDLTWTNWDGAPMKEPDLSKNKNLDFLFLSTDSLKHLNLSSNTNLTVISLSGGSLSQVDFPQQGKLTTLYIESNDLTSIDVPNASLSNLTLKNNPLVAARIGSYHWDSPELGPLKARTILYDPDSGVYDLKQLVPWFDGSKVSGFTSNVTGVSMNGSVISSLQGTDTIRYSYATGIGDIHPVLVFKPMPVPSYSDSVQATTIAGSAPVLPSKVTVHYTDGTTKEAPVTWNEIDWSKQKAGKVKVSGTAISDGKKVPATAEVTVNPQELTITFDANGGSAVASQSVRYGSKATQPTDPTRTGHTFQGWYTARSGGSKYDFNQTVTGDVTLYARWVKEPAALRRLSGATRYDTMEKIVGTGGWKSGGTVIVASGGNYPDALAASGLAGVLDAPIVLTDGSALSVQASARLTGLAPSRIIVVGGRAAVSDGVVAALRGICPDVERVAGETRVDTSLDLYRKGSGWGSTAILATSGNFADALSVSSYAYAAKAPVFLVDPGTGLTQAQKAALRTFKQVLVVGGENAVPSRHVAGLPGVTRLSGATRYETSERIAEWATGHGLGMDGVVYATGANFPDALAAGPLAGGAGAVTLLVEDAHSPAISFSAGYKGKVNRAYVVGGVNAVSQNTADAIADSLGLKHAQ